MEETTVDVDAGQDETESARRHRTMQLFHVRQQTSTAGHTVDAATNLENAPGKHQDIKTMLHLVIGWGVQTHIATSNVEETLTDGVSRILGISVVVK